MTLDAPNAPRQPVNLTNELAKERNRTAADRTLMAWVRTSLSLITFGFGIDKIIAAVNKTALGKSASAGLGVNIVAVSFIVIGIGALFAALVEHRLILKRIRHEDFQYAERRSVAAITASLIIVIGAIALATIVGGWF